MGREQALGRRSPGAAGPSQYVGRGVQIRPAQVLVPTLGSSPQDQIRIGSRVEGGDRPPALALGVELRLEDTAPTSLFGHQITNHTPVGRQPLPEDAVAVPREQILVRVTAIGKIESIGHQNPVMVHWPNDATHRHSFDRDPLPEYGRPGSPCHQILVVRAVPGQSWLPRLPRRYCPNHEGAAGQTAIRMDEPAADLALPQPHDQVLTRRGVVDQFRRLAPHGIVRDAEVAPDQRAIAGNALPHHLWPLSRAPVLPHHQIFIRAAPVGHRRRVLRFPQVITDADALAPQCRIRVQSLTIDQSCVKHQEILILERVVRHLGAHAVRHADRHPDRPQRGCGRRGGCWRGTVRHRGSLGDGRRIGGCRCTGGSRCVGSRGRARRRVRRRHYLVPQEQPRPIDHQWIGRRTQGVLYAATGSSSQQDPMVLGRVRPPVLHQRCDIDTCEAARCVGQVERAVWRRRAVAGANRARRTPGRAGAGQAPRCGSRAPTPQHAAHVNSQRVRVGAGSNRELQHSPVDDRARRQWRQIKAKQRTLVAVSIYADEIRICATVIVLVRLPLVNPGVDHRPIRAGPYLEVSLVLQDTRFVPGPIPGPHREGGFPATVYRPEGANIRVAPQQRHVYGERRSFGVDIQLHPGQPRWVGDIRPYGDLNRFHPGATPSFIHPFTRLPNIVDGWRRSIGSKSTVVTWRLLMGRNPHLRLTLLGKSNQPPAGNNEKRNDTQGDKHEPPATESA